MSGRGTVIAECLIFIGLLGLLGCGSPSSVYPDAVQTTETAEADAREEAETGDRLVYQGSMELKYAENFSVDYYEGGYTMLSTKMGSGKLLVIPEGKAAPKGLAEDVQTIRQPVENLYLVASSVMDMFAALDGLDAVRLSGQKAESWYVEEAREAMERSEILYAGKYNKPDYELIVSEKCSLAIENTMILHSPEVLEKMASFGIPTVVECSSYETHPLGRVEWVKFFGALLGKEEEAEKLFARQEAVMQEVSAKEKTDRTVAFFYITSNGLVQVRQSRDYVPKMIELAGGKYVFENVGDPESRRATMNMQVEEFYAGAKDADYLIYNSAIDGGVSSVEELIDKCSVLEDFKAVQEGNVWCTSNDMYQQSMAIGDMIGDIHRMLQGEEENMRYLFHLEEK